MASSPKVAFLGDSFMVADMSMSCACLLNSASKVCKKGLRDMGRLPALVGVWRDGEGMAGDVALLRNGFLELSSSERPGEGCRSVQIGEVRQAGTGRFVTASVGETGDKGSSVPGIDGSANMMVRLLATLRSGPNHTGGGGGGRGARLRWADDGLRAVTHTGTRAGGEARVRVGRPQ